MYGTGIARDGELIDLAVQLGIVQKSGAWFSYKETGWDRGEKTQEVHLRGSEALCRD